MNNKKTLIIFLLGFVFLLGGAYVLYTQLGQGVAPDRLSVQTTQPTDTTGTQATGDTKETTEADNKAPDFTVYDQEGKEVHLSDFLGKPVIVNFWASWCGPCQMEMPDFQEKYLEYGDQIHFLMINMTNGSRETVDSASEFIAQQGYTFPVFYDTRSDAATVYGVYTIPTTLFIDAEGNGIAMAMSAIDAQTLQQGIDMIR